MTIADINTLARFLTDTDTTSLSAANLLILINNAYERLVGKMIQETMNGWKFGDSNFTALPTGLFTLVNSQETYQLMGDQVGSGTGIAVTSATTQPLLTVLGVSVRNNSGTWIPLQPIQLSDILKQGIDPAEYFETDGLPTYYEKREDFLVLYPAPDNGVSVTLASGLKVFFQRTADVFTSAEVTTGTKVPGFPTPYHDVLSYMAAYEYAIARALPTTNSLGSEAQRKEKELLNFMARRNPDERKVMTGARIRFL